MKGWALIRRWGWPVVCGALLLALFVQHIRYAALRENHDLLQRLDSLQVRWCEGVERINKVCEGQFIEIMQRLGLDREMMPLLTTALWKRATNNFSVRRARAQLGAKVDTGFLDKSMGVGGPEERSCDCR